MSRSFIKIILIVVLQQSLMGTEDLESLKKLHQNHKVKSYKTWKNWKDKPLSKRVFPAPPNIVEYIGLDNKIYGFQGVPKSASYDKGFYKDFYQALEELPPAIKEKIKKTLIGVFFVKDLGSTGFSEHLYRNGKFYGSWILFDQELLLNIKANDWATWRVNTAFQKSDGYKLTLKIQEKKENNRKQAIQFILLHELGHVIGSASRAHPNPHKINGNPRNFPYSSLSWKSSKKTIYEKEFLRRKDFKLYRFLRAQVSVKDSQEMISQLRKTDFPSLYGSTTVFEDYAEAFTIYVHTVLMKKPYQLVLKKDGKLIESFENPFEKEIMKRKKKYFEKMF
ncbi:MAG: hypothetical protein OIF32_11060 [Campylobacterales bacterium]|nr:hypothetical protein [Campylobacterales bacterium]